MTDDSDTPDQTDETATYEAVCPHPDGETTPSRFAMAAAEHGYEGIVLRGSRETFEGGTDESSVSSGDPYGVDVVPGIELLPDSASQLGELVAGVRNRAVAVIVRGGDTEINRAAVEESRVDVLSRPFGTRGGGDGDVNHVLVKAARDNDVAVEFDLSPVVRSSGGRRVRALRRLRKLRELVDYYDPPFVVSGRPQSHLGLRSPRELVAVGSQIGFEQETVREGLERWGTIAARNRRRLSDSFIGEGIERGQYETEY